MGPFAAAAVAPPRPVVAVVVAPAAGVVVPGWRRLGMRTPG